MPRPEAQWYGESAGSKDTFLSRARGNMTLDFILNGDKVISIEYLPV